ncbi:hypothetical protein IU459_10620 [Nocardia amamiensis]|uniref:Transmembrane protein n=1 Tax=Nocardia amamiensis TaxID=404578 RepID=A0ABS0CN23_9NOCA|nr:hypothetical protein [Nocardia amamiensis]MBF6297999.1 hypothetical protein [Nocardia amamiensis]
MSEDSKQLSVAELLARNGQQGGASSGGGRRRRSGRGISVAELTGDLPVIREGGGHSAHAAPDAGAEEPAYAPPSFDPPAPEPVSYAPQPEPDPSAYSPISGPISMYDPLAGYAQPDPPRAGEPSQADYPSAGWSSRVMPGREMPGREMPSATRHSAPYDPLSPDTPVSELFSAAPGPYLPDPLSSGAVPETPPRSGRRRRREEPEEEAWHGIRPEPSDRGVLPDHGATEFGRSRHTEFDEPDFGRSERSRSHGFPEHNAVQGGRAARRRAAEAAEAAEELGPTTAAWSPTTGGFAPESQPLPLPDTRPKPGRPLPPDPQPDAHRRSSRSNVSGENGLPAWSARRHKSQDPVHDAAPQSGGIPTAAWSLASQDQQLVSGQTVAGDLLRDGMERAERGTGRGRRGARGAARSAVDVEELDGATDVYEPLDLDTEDEESEAAERPWTALRERARSPRRSRAVKKEEDDANRRQWMILGGQSTGAAVAGMLLFKGFERMWEMLPWVALALAMIVILGLVALVRILRRTDDILSTVIAVVVGIFVTLGPLAFLLSTN